MSAEYAVRALRALVTATGVEIAEADVYAFIETHKGIAPGRLWRAVEHWAVWRRGVPTAKQFLNDDPVQAWLELEQAASDYGSGKHPALPLLTNVSLDLCGGYRAVARRVMRGDPDVRLEFLSAYCHVALHETIGSTQTHDSTTQGLT